MFRVKTLITAALVSLAAVSCMERGDDKINREILLATVWEGECFQPAIVQQEGDPEMECLYVFEGDGILNVYLQSTGVTGRPLQNLRYIYTPQAAEMVIEEYGLFTVKEISVDRLLLEGAAGKLDLHFYGDIGIIERTVPE